MKFAQIAKELRESLGLSQMQLSKQLGISAAGIGHLELGKREPGSHTLIAYSQFFNVSVDYLLGLEDDFGVRTAAPMGDTYTAEERKIITNLRKLPQGMRDILRTTIDAMVADIEKNNVAD